MFPTPVYPVSYTHLDTIQVIVKNYFEPEEWVGEISGIDQRVIYRHRTMSDYVKVFVRNKFKIIDLNEPKPTEEQRKMSPRIESVSYTHLDVYKRQLYDCGYPVMAINHPTAKCEQKFDSVPAQAVLKDFVLNQCKAETNWNMKNFIEDQVELIRRQVGDKKVLLALSGGVDSSVVAAMLIKAIGQQLVCVHVNHGLMRKNESESVVEVLSLIHI